MRPISMHSTRFLPRRAAGWWAAVLLSACVIESPPLAVPDGDTDDPPAATVGRLTGVVEIESAALAPVRPAAPVGLEGATVEALVNGSVVASTTTAADGSWTLDELTPGTYAVRAWYETTAGVFAVVQDDVAVVAGNVVDLGRLQLELTGAIQGTVELADRGDWSNAQVFIPGSSFVAITGSNGKFTLLYVPEGVWTVRATAAGYSAVTVSDVTVKAGEVTILTDPIVLIPTDAEVAIPETTILTKPATLVDSGSATFSFAADLPSSFQCRLDGLAWAVCASPTTYSDLAEGSHTFEVRASTGPGVIDATPATWTWTVDLTPPETTIVSAPSGYVAAATATVTFGGSDNYGVASFECRMDGGSWAACTSPHALSGLSAGTRLFEVRAIDAAGHADPTPATATWTVDLVAPDTSLTSGPTGGVSGSSTLFAFSGTDNYGVASFECRLDAGAWAACTSPHLVLDVAEGAHTFEVRAVDVANVADATPAAVAWTAGASTVDTLIHSGPDGSEQTAAAVFTFGCDGAQCVYWCRLDGGAWERCISPKTYTALAVGDHTFDVRAVDDTATADPTPAQWAWTALGVAVEWIDLSAGHLYTCGIRTDGTLWCWGYNEFGQLGDGTAVDKSNPTQVGISMDWENVSAGGWHTCGVRTGGTLWCWGWNLYGQLGDGTTADKWSPTQVGTSSSWQSVSTGSRHTCGVSTDGKAWCWGNNESAQLGNGWRWGADTTEYTSTPEQVGSSADWRSISTGDGHTCGIRSDGTAWCWGGNNYGQIGDGTAWTRLPTQVGTSTDWQSISPRGSHTCGVRADSTLWCWGRNYFGQLGDDSTEDKSTPMQVGVSVNWQSVTAGGSHTCGVGAGGTAWCWGYNGSGQLGDDTIENKSIPTQVVAVGDWERISAGSRHSCGIRTDGAVWCWGDNEFGQLGNDATAWSTVPVAVTEP